MAAGDNPIVRAGTAGNEITVAGDHTTIFGGTAIIQAIQIHDGTEGGTVGAIVTSSGQLVTFVGNNGTVSITGTPNVHVTNSGTVIQGTQPWQVRPWMDHAGTVIQGTSPWVVTANGGTILGAQGTVIAHVNNNGTVSVSAISAGDNNIGNVDVVTVPADPFGANADAAVAAGATGSIQAKLRRLTSDLDAVKTAVETLDNTVSGSELQVDVVAALPTGTNNIGDVDVATIAAGDNNIGNVDIVSVPADPFGANADAAVAAGATGSIQAKLRRLTSDLDAVKTAVEILDNTVSGSELQVDVVAALPTGANAIGKLAANSGVDIGDVDVTSVPADPFGVNADAAVAAGATGSIQAKLRRLTSDLDAVKTAVETLDNTVSGSELQVDVVAALPAGTNNIGDVDVLSVIPGTGATNLGKAEDDPHSSGDVGVQALAVRTDTPAAKAAAADYHVLETNAVGGLWTDVVPSGTAVHSTTAGTVTMGTLLATNAARYGFAVHNDTDNVLYLRLGDGAASTAFTVRMTSQSHYESPFRHTGLVTGVWSANGGSAHVSEFRAS